MRDKQFPHKPNPSGAEKKQKNKLVEKPTSLPFHPDHYLDPRLRDLVFLARYHQALRQERFGEDTARGFAGYRKNPATPGKQVPGKNPGRGSAKARRNFKKSLSSIIGFVGVSCKESIHRIDTARLRRNQK
ncbi:MAG: hypothetical protein HYU31_20965 [Deltaproteobacteria bacterium]|nr:hypothetical protein [Deltaproteobacteria bacterium]